MLLCDICFSVCDMCEDCTCSCSLSLCASYQNCNGKMHNELHVYCDKLIGHVNSSDNAVTDFLCMTGVAPSGNSQYG